MLLNIVLIISCQLKQYISVVIYQVPAVYTAVIRTDLKGSKSVVIKAPVAGYRNRIFAVFFDESRILDIAERILITV